MEGQPEGNLSSLGLGDGEGRLGDKLCNGEKARRQDQLLRLGLGISFVVKGRQGDNLSNEGKDRTQTQLWTVAQA